jgi:hypothetical protein
MDLVKIDVSEERVTSMIQMQVTDNIFPISLNMKNCIFRMLSRVALVRTGVPENLAPPPSG